MKLKKLLLIFTILVVLMGINASFAMDSDSIDGESAVSSISNGSDSSILEVNDGNQELYQGNVIIIDAEDGHNEMEDSTIQVAINNANANDTIIINGKSYVHCHFVVDKPLTIISNVATSMTPCPSNTQGSGYRGIFYISPEASGTVIDGFTINNNMVSGENDYGLLIRGASDVIVRNCVVTSSAQADAIRIENAKNALVENCTVNSVTNAIRIKNSQNTVVNVSVVKNSNVGINLIESIGAVLTNNVITSNKASGIYVGDKTSDTSILFNNITGNNGKGIDTASADNLSILNNYIAFNRNGDSGAGIYINCNVNGLDIKGNVLQENGNYAVLYDYRVRNIGPDGLGENVASVDNNYIFGHSDRAIYHIVYNKDSQGSFIYDADKDEYIAVGYGNGDYSVGMTTAYLGYSYLISEQLCPSIYYTWGQLWSAGNYRLVLSDISQINKGKYAISVVDPNGDIAADLSSIYVTFYLNKNNNQPTPQEGDVYKTVLIQNGTATASFTVGDYNTKDNILTVSFPGPYPSLTGNPFKSLNIPDSEIPGEVKETVLTLANLTTYPNSGECVTANLKDSDGRNLAGKNITFVIDSQRYVVKSDDEGNAKLNISFSTEGTYDLAAIFEGDGIDYFSSEAQATVIVRKIATNIESEDYYAVPGIADYYTITLNDESCNPVSGQNVTFTLDGESQVVTTDFDGKASLSVLFDENDTDYGVSVTFAGNDKYVSSSNSSFIHVIYSSKDAQLIVPVRESLPNELINYSVTLIGFDGEALEGEQLIINIDGVEYRNYTDLNGQVTIDLQLNELKDYDVVALYEGSDIYKSVSNSSYIRVAKANTSFVAENITVLPYVESQIPVGLITYDNESISNQEFSYEIEGASYFETTDGNGQALISYTFSNEGIYSVKLNYGGCDIYESASATIYVNAKRITSIIESYDRTFSKGSSKNFTITLCDENGDAIAGQEIIFTVDGKNISKTTDSSGRAGINVASKAGSFDVAVYYAGSDRYTSDSKINEVTVLDEGNIVYVDKDLPNSEIQNVLDSCDDGDIVIFLGDEYDNISLIVSKGLDISPKNETTLNAKQSLPAFIILANSTSISGFSIVANESDGIYVGADNVRIEANDITNSLDSSKSGEYYNSTISLPGYGIDVSDSCNVEIINNSISLFESGIYAEETSGLFINRNNLRENNYGIKYGFGVSDSQIINNTITDSIGLYTMEVPEGPRGYGIFLNNSAVNVTIIGNVITWNHLGISFDANASTGIVATSNLITDNVLEGIRFNAGYDLAEDAVEPIITDNAIYRNARGPSMMILGEMSANPFGIYGPGEWDDDAKLKIAANWYGVNSLQTWNNETGIVGIGTMCPRIKTYEIKFDKIDVVAPGTYSITFTKDGEVASNLCEFDLYATLNKGTEQEQEVNFKVINGVGQFSFDLSKFVTDNNFIDMSVGSLHSQERVFKSFYTSRIKVGTGFSVVYDESASQLLITLTSEFNDQPVRGSNIAVAIDGVNSTLKTDYNGQVKVSAAKLASGTHTVDAYYKGTTKYNPASTSVDFIIKTDTDLSVINNANELVATLTNAATGQAIQGANVRFVINNDKYTVKTNSNGQAVLSTSDLASGTHTVTVSYNGNSKYNPSNTSIDITIKSGTDLVVGDFLVEYGVDSELSAILINSETGQAIKGANVIFEVNGDKLTAKTDASGQAKVTVSGLNPGKYTASVSYKGNGKYKPSGESFNVAVSKITTRISLYWDAKTNELVATLINAVTGSAIKGGNVVFNLNGTKTSVKTDKLGQARLAVSGVNPEYFHAAISYGGNSKYLKSIASINIIAGKIPTQVSNVYDRQTQEAVATLINSETGQAIKGATVVFNINGVKTAFKTDKLGQVKISVADLDLGQNSISSSYGGNSKYTGSTANINIVKT